VPAQLPKISLASLPSPPQSGSIQFFDGYFPALSAGNYGINVKHTMSGQPGTPPPFELPQQTFLVQAPEFFIDTTIVQTFYPPSGGSDTYGQQLPFLIMTDPSLPWERGLIPGKASSPLNPASWMALLIFAEGEIYLQPNSSDPVATGTVADFLASSQTVLKPQLPSGWVSEELLASECRTITIPGAAFSALVPSKLDLPLLAHCRGVNTLDEGERLLSVILCNRLAVPNSTVNPAAPLRYYAHLVSLEGFANYMPPNPRPIPNKPGSTELMDVQLASLFNWTFVSQPQTGLGFEELIAGLIQSEQAEGPEVAQKGALSLPVPAGASLPPEVQSRLENGYVPLEFVSGSGDDTFAWYRGPFSAVVPQALPSTGNPPVPVSDATSADELMIYLAEQGLFDLSYAAAWNLGRALALADPNFAQNVSKYRVAARGAVNLLSQRMTMRHLAGVTDARKLLATDASRRTFSRSMGEGLGRQWTEALRGAREGSPPVPETVQRLRKPRFRSVSRPEHLLGQPSVAGAVAENLNDVIDSIAKWLANLSLVFPVPFSYLVPDPRMLPVESIRFFYIDSNWIDALTAGALSIAIHNSLDASLHQALLPTVRRAVATGRRNLFSRTRSDAAFNTSNTGAGMSGMLIRSQLVPAWPQLLITATLGGAPVNIVRNDCPSPNVRLCIFDGIPDTVTLAEPYQGVLFGVEDLGIHPRCVTSPAFTGSLIANESPVKPTLRTPASGKVGGVLEVRAIASALESPVGVTPFDSKAVVQWNGSPLPTTFVTENQLTAIVPASAIASPGTASLTVFSAGVTSLPVRFIIDAPLQIDSIEPAIINAGATEFVLNVSGVGFDTGATVQWNGAALATTVISAREATAVVPANLIATVGSAAITVLSSGATSNGVTIKVVGGAPVIDSLQPNVAMAGGPGFVMRVLGSAFTSNAVVNWNGNPLATRFVNDQELAAPVNESLIATKGTAAVTVNVEGTDSSPVSFTISGAEPTTGSLQPAVAMSGGAEFQLVVDGLNFGGDARVQWNGTALTTKVDDSKQLTATVPASLLSSAGIASITVVSRGVTSNALPFTVLGPQPVIGLLEPASVVAGGPQFQLRVTGGFGAGDFALQMVAAPELQSFTTG
jgi:hypothetical protein